MSDTNKTQFQQTLLIILILLLFLLVSYQAWTMFGMKKQLDTLHQQQSSVLLQAPSTTVNENNIPEQKHTVANNTEELPDAQQSSVLLQAPGTTVNENIIPEQKHTVANNTEELPDEQQLSVLLQAPGTTVNENNIPEQKHTVAKNTEELPDEQQTSLPENQNAPSAQSRNKSISPDNTPPLISPPTSDTTFGGQAWNPYREIERMQHDMDRTFNRRSNRFNNSPDFNNPGINRPDFEYHFSQNISTPEIDIKENANQYIVLVNLPGADKKDISVTLNGQRLSIKGKQDYKKQNRDAMGNIIFQARQSGRFQRSITLSKPVDQNKMKTRLENGVLIIIIPKVKTSQWR